MSDINQIILFELNKMGKMIQAGKLSKKSIDVLKKTKTLKSQEHYIKGLDTGTNEIIRKNKMRKISNSKAANIGGGGLAVYPLKKDKNPIIHVSSDKDLKKSGWDSGDKEILKRHEAIEGREAIKARKKLGYDTSHVFMKDRKIPFIDKHIPIPVGSHVNARPIQSDKYHSDFLHNAFGLGKKIKKAREKTGEFEFLKNKKKIRKINNFKFSDDRPVSLETLKSRLKNDKDFSKEVGKPVKTSEYNKEKNKKIHQDSKDHPIQSFLKKVANTTLRKVKKTIVPPTTSHQISAMIRPRKREWLQSMKNTVPIEMGDKK